MISFVTGYDGEIGEWVARQVPWIGTRARFGPYTTLGVVLEDRLIAGIVYSDFYPEFGSMEMSIASVHPAWCSRRVLRKAFEYPFGQMRCARVNANSARKNKRARRLLEGVGFKLEGVRRRGLGSDDAMIYGMLRRECRWLEEEYGQTQSTIAA